MMIVTPCMSALDMQYKEKRIFSAVVPLCVLPLLGCLRGCVPSFGEGAESLSLLAGVGRLWGAVRVFVEDGSEALGPFPRDERKSRRKNRRFCCASSLTTARSAGSCGILKERCSGREVEAMTLFSVEFGCFLRAAENGRAFRCSGTYLGTGLLKNCAA